MRVSRFWQFSTCAALALAAACSDSSTGPATLSNPLATSAAIASLDSAFSSPVLASFGILSSSFAPTAALAPAGRILDATRPRPIGPGMSSEADAVRRLSRLRQLALSPANPQGPVIPDSLYGSIYTWDTASAQYTRSAVTGGPANGVRFILYAVNPFTASVALPLTPVGQTDLLDESAGLTAKLHIIVSGVGGTPTYVDYTSTLTFGSLSVTAALNGTLSNGIVGANNKTLTFTVSATFTLTSSSAHATYALNNPSITIVLDAADVTVQTTDSVTLVFTFTRPGETVSLSGLVVTTSDVLDTVTAAIKVNGQPYASVKGNALTVAFYDNTGALIQDTVAQHDILVALDDFRIAVIVVLDFTAALFGPIVNLLNS